MKTSEKTGSPAPPSGRGDVARPGTGIPAARRAVASRLRRLFRIGDHPATVAPPVLSFADMESDLSRQFEIAAYSGRPVFRARLEGSFRVERNILAAFVKTYLASQGLSGRYSRSLIDDFRDYILVDAKTISAEMAQTLK